MFPSALAFCAGALLPLGLPALAPAWALALFAGGAGWCRRRLPLAAAGLCGLALASALIGMRLEREWPCTRDREAVTLQGRVSAPALMRPGRVDFELEGEAPLRLRVRLSWYQPEAVPQPGERWRVSARLRCRRGLANPGAADRELDLLRQGVGATGYLLASPAPARLAGEARGETVQGLRARVAQGIAAALPPGASAAVLQGLSVGLRGNLPEALWDAFAATGTAHLIAISGLHVTACAAFALSLLRSLRRLPALAQRRRWIALESIVVVAATAAYTALAGAATPALRTLAMVALFAGLRLLRRHPGVHQTLAFAALVLIAADPLAAATPGFWLSFVATAALLAVASEGRGLGAALAGFVRSQAAIGVALAPVLLASFGRLSLIAPLANALAIPVFSFLLLPPVLVATLLELAGAAAAAPIWQLLATVLDAWWPRLIAAAQWPLAEWWPAAQPLWLLAAAGGLAVAALLLPLAGLRCAAVVAMLALAAGRAPPSAGEAWSLAVLDVGQGLSAVVATRTRTLVFDTGPRWRGGGTAAEVALLPYLHARGIRRIDRLILSHDDLDHAGGAQVLAREFPVALRQPCLAGQQWRWDRVEFRVLHPPAGMRGSDNDRSCALHVSGPGGSALLLADPEAEAEALLVQQRLVADVVLLPHHGSRSSSSPALVAAVGARLGIASAGAGNRWGMPAAAVVARWRGAGTTVLSTAAHGAVTIRFRGDPPSPAIAIERGPRRWWRPAAAP